MLITESRSHFEKRSETVKRFTEFFRSVTALGALNFAEHEANNTDWSRSPFRHRC